jgi:hypothetical protein
MPDDIFADSKKQVWIRKVQIFTEGDHDEFDEEYESHMLRLDWSIKGPRLQGRNVCVEWKRHLVVDENTKDLFRVYSFQELTSTR